MSKESRSPFKKLFEGREEPVVPELEVSQAPTPSPPQVAPLPQAQPQTEPRKRGRPATGKRSDDAWIGRTFYVQRENDLDVEDELLKLKRQGIEIDKSELVDALLGAWVKWRQGENIEIHLDEITPRRNL
ncbi:MULTISPECIES: hypothetical protein [Trichocoleus]|uniref:Uncharacterized protein n=1 Tax=Trichocoleus desertorum GB2-A4 TaxID=2933944 RepID=A0ABV0JFN6_9CYAN|nr:hypothetical protein [Trichocoleus sp. FACHB-46]MBD1865691.1 hypothetical protein [Trichocoleus sp. FACHB-46]